MALMTPLRRIRDDRDLALLEAALAGLQAETTKLLETHINAQYKTGNDRHSGAHQSTSNTESHHDLEPASKEEGRDARNSPTNLDATELTSTSSEPYPLGMVLEACRDVKDYAPAGRVRTWSDFLAAAAAVRPMIGISPDAWHEACQVLSPAGAAIAVAMILQRSEYSSETSAISGSASGPFPGSQALVINGSPVIHSAGGYLRALTDKARAGAFTPGPMLMAIIGQRAKFRHSFNANGRSKKPHDKVIRDNKETDQAMRPDR
jgi:replication initiation protein RepC